MDHQTQMNGAGTREPPAQGVARSAAELWHHILTLSELQVRLLSVELSDGVRRAKMGAVFVIFGCLIGLAALPVVLACAALTLMEATQWTPAQSFGLISGVAVLMSAMFIAAGWWQFRHEMRGIPRSREEWNLNWHWLKNTLRLERASRYRVHSPTGRPS